MTNIEKKLTKRQKFAMLLDVPAVAEDEVLSDFVNHEIELLDKKNATKGDKKPTEKQKQNSAIGENIVEFMSPNTYYTASDLLKRVPNLPEDMSLPRITHIITALVNDKRIVRTVEKRKAYFSLP